MPHNGSMRSGTVVGRTIADDGRVYGTYDDNPYETPFRMMLNFKMGQ